MNRKRKRIIYFSLLIMIILLILTSYFSYAFFTNKKEAHGKLNIVVGTLDYTLESKNLESNRITIAKNTISRITLTLSSLNEIDSKYFIYYNLDKNVEGVEIKYMDVNDMPHGTIEKQGKKEITVRLKNASDETITVTFGVVGGFVNNELIFTQGNAIEKYIDTCDYQQGYEFVFDYIGEVQEFVVPCEGNYKIELWGAQGGSMDGYIGGKGAYTTGSINLSKNSNLYVFVGGAGSDIDYSGSYNGGGIILDEQIIFGRNGGGATDIRLIGGEWNNFSSLKSRIMVAAGGGGANNRNAVVDDYWYGAGNGGAGGDLIGINGESPSDTHTNPETGYVYGWNYGTGGTQIRGGSQIANDTQYEEGFTDNWKTVGQFGYAQQHQSQSGGGSGYYGGGSTGHGGAGGGSSFISGYEGCDAIAESSTEDNIIHTGQANHYSGYVFANSIMIAGNSSMPMHDGTSTMIGNSGNGYAKITYLEP